MKHEAMINLVIGGAVTVGFFWTQLKSIPRLDERVGTLEVQTAVLKNDITYIKQGVELLVRDRRGSRRDDNAR